MTIYLKEKEAYGWAFKHAQGESLKQSFKQLHGGSVDLKYLDNPYGHTHT